MPMTESQIRATVDRMDIRNPKHKTALLRNALVLRDHNTLAVLQTNFRRQQNGTTAADAVAAWARSQGLNPDGSPLVR